MTANRHSAGTSLIGTIARATSGMSGKGATSSWTSVFGNAPPETTTNSSFKMRGGRWRLVYLKVDPALLRQRLDLRSQRFDANAAFPITDDILNAYVSGFEEPNGEGEEVITAPF